MPWLRHGDNALTHPSVSALADVKASDARTRNEVWGFIVLAASISAAHLTDGVLDRGTLELVGLSRWKKLTDQAVEAGLLKQSTKGGKMVWRLIEDPDLLHIRARDEVEWEKQRKRDQSNPALTAPVRARDGDACRYCSKVVNWAARTGGRRGCYDHRSPGAAATVETYVVACYSCNSSRKDDPNADQRLPLLPAPERPIYGPQTKAFLRAHRDCLPDSWQALSEEPSTPLTEQGEAPGRVRARVGSGSGREGFTGTGLDGRPPAQRAEEAS
jgi:hypothetical protein